jgi:hypothetical protein
MMPKVPSVISVQDRAPSTLQASSVASAPHQEATRALERNERLQNISMRGLSKRQSHDANLPAKKHRRIESPYKQKTLSNSEENRIQVSPKSAHSAHSTCRKCRQIDFEKIFNQDMRDPKLCKIWGHMRHDLSYIKSQSSCTLCRFFYSVREPVPDNTATHPYYYLHIFPAKDELGAWKLQFDNSPGFRVAPALRSVDARKNPPGMIMEVSGTKETFRGYQVQPEVDLAMIKGWLSFCGHNHKTMCKRKFDPKLPIDFRVIDCITRKIIFWKDITARKQYVTLSYVWGRPNQDAIFQEGVIPQGVPRTIEDSLLLTTKLGYRYLWIDRYCITQDDVMSRQIQIQSMDIIYQHSVMTVIAAAGIDPNHGLPGVGEVLRERQPTVEIGDRTLVYAPFAKEEILSSKWNSRGWTYQEGLLSYRKLVFTTTQVYFQCNAMHCLESIQGPLETLHTHKNVRMRDDIDISRVFPLRGLGKSQCDLKERIDEYLKRSLTNENDIHDAIKGILAAFERKFPGKIRCIYGIPMIHNEPLPRESDRFVMGLSWYARYHVSGDDPVFARRTKYPSWTWLGWNMRGVYFRSELPRSLDNPGHRTVARVNVEYSDGTVLSWSEDKSMIHDREISGLTPVFLHLHGPAFDVHISESGYITGDDEGRAIEQIRILCPELNSGLVQLVRSAYPPKQKVSCSLKVTLLISYQWDDEIHILVLYQPEGFSYFERIDTIFFHLTYRSIKLYYPLEKKFNPDTLMDWAPRDVLIG